MWFSVYLTKSFIVFISIQKSQLTARAKHEKLKYHPYPSHCSPPIMLLYLLNIWTTNLIGTNFWLIPDHISVISVYSFALGQEIRHHIDKASAVAHYSHNTVKFCQLFLPRRSVLLPSCGLASPMVALIPRDVGNSVKIGDCSYNP